MINRISDDKDIKDKDMNDKDMNDKLIMTIENEDFLEEAQSIAKHIGIEIVDEPEEGQLFLKLGKEGLSLNKDGLEMHGDFTQMGRRLKQSNLSHEFLVKASRIKGADHEIKVLDATAGMGEDSLILAAAGFRVSLYEYNPVIAALLRDTMRRAMENEELRDIVSRMELFEEDSIEAMKKLDYKPDIIVLDPMFPERQKSASVKKKFQLLQQLECPCSTEEELLTAAKKCGSRKIVIKRPLKGAYLDGIKPDYSIDGKAIRYDIIFN